MADQFPSEVPNPFLQDWVASPWHPSFNDVAEINRTAFEQCLTSIRQVRQGNQSRGLVMYGEPGAGKTHLLQRLRLHTQSEPRAWFIYVPPFTGPARFWRHLLERFFYDLCQRSKQPGIPEATQPGRAPQDQGPGQGPLTQIEEALTRHLVERPLGSTQELAVWWAEICRQDLPGEGLFRRLERTFRRLTVELHLDPDVMKVLRHYLSWNHRSSAYAYLLGRDLAEDELALLGVAGSLDDEERAKQAVLTFCRLAGDRFSIILAFDQLEGLQLTPEDLDGLRTYALNAVQLMSECSNLLVLSAVQVYFLRTLRQAMHLPYYDRIAQDESVLTLLGRESAVRLIASRLQAQPELQELRQNVPGAGALWPFDQPRIEQLVPAGGISARELIRKARDLFENYRGTGPVPPGPAADAMARHWDEELEEELSQPIMRPDEGVYEDGILKLLQVKPPRGCRVDRGKDRDLHALLECGQERTGISISNSENMTSLARHLGRLQDLIRNRRVSKVVFVRDARLPISQTAIRARERLKELSQPPNRVIRPTAEAYAALNVLRRLWSKVAERDLTIGDRNLEMGELQQWLADHTPRVLQGIIDDISGSLQPQPETLERLKEILAGKWIMKLEDAAAQLGIPGASLARSIETEPEVAGVLAGPPAVVFLTPDAVSRM